MTATPYYSDEYVTLYHGDCLEIAEWLDADVLVTDPPYGIRIDRRLGDARHAKEQRRERGWMAGDDSTVARDDALAQWGDRPALVFGSWRVERPSATRSMLIWHKAGLYTGPTRSAFFTNHEEIYVIGEGWVPSCPPLRSVITTTEHRAVASAQLGHPTTKPQDLMIPLIDRCPDGTIADPFAGSGSTLVAARKLARRAIGVELEERYCEIAARRLAQGVLDFGAAS